MKGLQIYPGVIDNDCTGVIKVMAKAVAPTEGEWKRKLTWKYIWGRAQEKP